MFSGAASTCMLDCNNAVSFDLSRNATIEHRPKYQVNQIHEDYERTPKNGKIYILDRRHVHPKTALNSYVGRWLASHGFCVPEKQWILSKHDLHYGFSVWEIESARDIIVTINNEMSRNRFWLNDFFLQHFVEVTPRHLDSPNLFFLRVSSPEAKPLTKYRGNYLWQPFGTFWKKHVTWIVACYTFCVNFCYQAKSFHQWPQ